MTMPNPPPASNVKPLPSRRHKWGDPAYRRHKWGDPAYLHRDTTPSGCDETEKPCVLCGLVKLTVHTPIGYPYRMWRTRAGLRFPDDGATPLCEGGAP